MSEKLGICDFNTLSDEELLSLLMKDKEAAKGLLKNFPSLKELSRAEPFELLKIKGIGKGKTMRVLISIEFSKRLLRNNQSMPLLTSPQAVADFLMPEMKLLEQEVMKVLVLDTKNRLIKSETVFVESLNLAVVQPREIFKLAIRHGGASIICVHNHPSGFPEPSSEDIRVTKKLKEVGELLEIPILDHIIIGDGSFVSLKEEGLLEV